MTNRDARRELDGLDAEILLALIDQPTATTVALAQRLSVSRNTVQARLQKLNDNVLDSFQRRLSPRSLGYEVSAFMNASIRQGYDKETMAALSEIPEVLEIYATTGDADLRLTVVAESPEDLYRVNRLILEIPGIVRTSTAVVLKEFLSYRIKPLLQRIAD
ncbi:Lrp/AsnC family transcriptional regulator [Enteractinococcus fodinae]|uniref:DNA-binding Lrp family transcriptional regulator n=1 Tax=Enteractinococcus fodinae TaxID=684663 RepID=A0ABU2AXC8_9MICC|nr:Lrp/AsnC family transcriptional regulator [Enteractinococcus fodinae]MDR7346003.1 DNA-binding Lrp family transcriptional regulator [Enteractinococcus fodinae]